MPILKPKDITFNCPAPGADLNAILLNAFRFSGIKFIQTDTAGGTLHNQPPTNFFAANRVVQVRPIETRPSAKYSSLNYDCVLTLARPVNAGLEVQTVNVDGQYTVIVEELLSLSFINTFKSYFTCCDYPIQVAGVRPVYNRNDAVKDINYTGVEITFTITLQL